MERPTPDAVWHCCEGFWQQPCGRPDCPGIPHRIPHRWNNSGSMTVIRHCPGDAAHAPHSRVRGDLNGLRELSERWRRAVSDPSFDAMYALCMVQRAEELDDALAASPATEDGAGPDPRVCPASGTRPPEAAREDYRRHRLTCPVCDRNVGMVGGFIARHHRPALPGDGQETGQ